jgi:hypothetical protein
VFPNPIMEELSDVLVITPTGAKVTVRTDHYAHGGGLAVELYCEDGEPYATVSINVPGVPLSADEFVFKTYSENEGLLEAMLDAGVVELAGRSVGLEPICRLRPTIDELVRERDRRDLKEQVTEDAMIRLGTLKASLPVPDWLKKPMQ